MTDQKKIDHARYEFDILCRALDENGLRYNKDEDGLKIECGVQGEDLPMNFKIAVDAERMLVKFLSHLPLVIQEDKRLEVAVAVSAINNVLAGGCFDYDISSGQIFFRMTNSLVDSNISKEVFLYMLLVSCQTVDEFNDKFLMLAKGMISLEKFLETLAN